MARKAIALSGEAEENLDVLAKGEGELAGRIVAIAREHGIKVIENEYMVNVLMGFNPGDKIPKRVYGLIAEVMSFFQSILV